MPSHLGFAPLRLARGRLRLAQGKAGEALEDLRAGGRNLAKGGMHSEYYPWAAYTALALAALGDDAEALHVAEQELERARAWGVPRTIGIALRTLGLVEGGAKGLGLLREAVAVLET